MKNMIALICALLAPVAALAVESGPTLGVAEGRCRPGQQGSTFYITVVGLKDRTGQLKAELTQVSSDFLGDDSVIVNAGRPFRRVYSDIPASGPVQLCIRAPGPGSWAIVVLHDRDRNNKIGISSDGVGFPTNPNALYGLPRPAAGQASVGNAPASIVVRMLYRSSLISFAPIRQR